MLLDGYFWNHYVLVTPVLFCSVFLNVMNEECVFKVAGKRK